jgi:hypothetical protein
MKCFCLYFEYYVLNLCQVIKYETKKQYVWGQTWATCLKDKNVMSMLQHICRALDIKSPDSCSVTEGVMLPHFLHSETLYLIQKHKVAFHHRTFFILFLNFSAWVSWHSLYPYEFWHISDFFIFSVSGAVTFNQSTWSRDPEFFSVCETSTVLGYHYIL